jgi:thioredoxin 1
MMEVTDENSLTKELKANPKVIALFYASWCPFCRSFLSIFSKYAQKSGAALFMQVKIDDDENPLWEKYAFEAVPSIIFFKEGQVSKRLDCKLGCGLNEKQFSRWLEML